MTSPAAASPILASSLPVLGWIAAGLMGTTLGLLGGGGAILTVPILVYLFAHPAMLATQESLLVVGLVSAIGMIPYIKRRALEFRTAFLFALPSFAGVLVSRKLLLPNLPDTIVIGSVLSFSKDTLVLASFAAVMILAARTMLRSGGKQGSMKQPGSLAKVGTQGFAVGLVTGFVGAGGGFLIVPALTGLLGVPMERAVGTSLLIITLNSLFGFTTSLSAVVLSQISWSFLAAFGGLAAGGILIGGRLNARVPAARLKRAFGWLVLIMGTLILALQIAGH